MSRVDVWTNHVVRISMDFISCICKKPVTETSCYPLIYYMTCQGDWAFLIARRFTRTAQYNCQTSFAASTTSFFVICSVNVPSLNHPWPFCALLQTWLSECTCTIEIYRNIYYSDSRLSSLYKWPWFTNVVFISIVLHVSRCYALLYINICIRKSDF